MILFCFVRLSATAKHCYVFSLSLDISSSETSRSIKIVGLNIVIL